MPTDSVAWYADCFSQFAIPDERFSSHSRENIMRSELRKISILTLTIVSGIGALLISRRPENLLQGYYPGVAGKSIDPLPETAAAAAPERMNEPHVPGRCNATLEISSSGGTSGCHPMETPSYDSSKPNSVSMMEKTGRVQYREVPTFFDSYENVFSNLRKNHLNELQAGCGYIIRLQVFKVRCSSFQGRPENRETGSIGPAQGSGTPTFSF